jgi:hypothetical protein
MVVGEMSKIKSVLLEFLEEGYFDEWRTPSEIVKKLSQRGITIRGRKKGMVCRILTQMCQDRAIGLERDEIPKENRTCEEKWRYRKMR